MRNCLIDKDSLVSIRQMKISAQTIKRIAPLDVHNRHCEPLVTVLMSMSTTILSEILVKIAQLKEHNMQHIWSYESKFLKMNKWLKYFPRVQLELLVKYYS